jgi:hypothetical protein
MEKEGCACKVQTVDVAHQPHYESQKIQPIEYMAATMKKDQFIGFLQGNVIKYISRADKKNGIEDLRKAKVYLTWLIEYSEKGEIKV